MRLNIIFRHIIFLFPVVVCLLLTFPARADTPEDAACSKQINEGNQFLWKFKANEAWESYHKALHLADAVTNHRAREYWQAEALLGIGQALWYQGRFQLAADTVFLSVQMFKNVRSYHSAGTALRILGNIYDDKGDYEKSFISISEALDLFSSRQDSYNGVLSLVLMAVLYKNIGDYETSMSFFEQAQRRNPRYGDYPYREMNLRIGEWYAAQKEFNVARGYYHNALIGDPRRKLARLRIGESFLQEKKYDTAFLYLDSLYKEAKLVPDINIVTSSMLALGKIYFFYNNIPKALEMTNGALELSTVRGAKKIKRDASELLSAIYEKNGDAASALRYYKQYELVKDSMISDNLKAQMFAFRQRTEAEEWKVQRNIIIASFIGVIVLCLSVFFIIHLRYKNETLRLQQRASNLEMKALRAQMNPHFIFNCLSSINHFILNEENDKASEYLTRFSRLMRMVLVNAGKTTISLEDELATLKLYLNMEQLRFKEAFDYYIYSDAEVQPADVMVPSFILQPFCENAIWHGLLHKEGKGKLSIHFSMDKQMLVCTISDNGIGRKRAAELKTSSVEKGVSFGNRLSAERLALYNADSGVSSFVMEDIVDKQGELTGTQVILKIHNKHTDD